MQADFQARLDRVIKSVKDQGVPQIEFALMTGTGLGAICEALSNTLVISYEQIEGFPHASAPGHEGALHIGDWQGRKVAVFAGRLHLYEGHSPDNVVLPVFLAKSLGARGLILTNAAGALSDEIERGDIVCLSDQINMQGVHALAGPNPDRLGVRFPDMSAPFHKGWQDIIANIARDQNTRLSSGIYVGVHGPELESNAERRFLRLIGADIVGMSTVQEVIAAQHAGLDVLGLSAITNKATGAPDQAPDRIEDILVHAGATAPKIINLIKAFLVRGDI